MASPEFLKFLGSMQNTGFHGNEMKKPSKFFFSQTGWQILKIFCRNVPWVTSIRFLEPMLFGKKTWPPGGVGGILYCRL